EVLGAYALERGQTAAEHMIASRKQPRAVERPEVCDLLDHTQQLLVAARVLADRTRIGSVDVAAGRAGRELVGDLRQRGEQRLERRLALLHQVEDRTPRRPRAEPGEPR